MWEELSQDEKDLVALALFTTSKIGSKKDPRSDEAVMKIAEKLGISDRVKMFVGMADRFDGMLKEFKEQLA